MRIPILATALAAVAISAIPATAQQRPRQSAREYRSDVRDAHQDFRRDIRNADSRRDVVHARQEYRHDMRDAQHDYRSSMRDWRHARNYNYNRYEPGYSHYYADRYYRTGGYRPIRLTRNDRVYYGRDNRYYCRRSDGTTGLIVGGLAGGVLGNSLTHGDSRVLGTLIGAGAGAALGSAVDRGNVVCN